MKRLFGVLLAGCLIASTGCAAATAETADAQPAAQDTETVAVMANTENTAAQPDPADRPEPMDDDSLMAQVGSVSDTEITVYLADRTMPEDGEGPGERGDGQGPGGSRGERPDGDGEPPEGMPEGGPGQRGDRQGGGRGMQFSDEETVYTLSGSVAVVKGMGDDETALSPSDLVEGDNVRIVLDDDGAVESIHIMEEPDMNDLPDRQGPPKEEEEA